MLNKNIPFLWGAATSSHQVEGDNRENDWWDWEQAGRVSESSGLACDHYRRFRNDFDILTKLGHNAHRFSVEWSRIEPRENEWNAEALRHYEEVVKDLRSRNIEPVVTLHHFTNPRWLAAKGGWADESVADYFERFTDKVVSVLGPYVRFWVTINEPLIYLYHGFYYGVWPPGLNSFDIAMRVLVNQLEAHNRSYHRIHKLYAERFAHDPYVSIAKHVSAFDPCNPRKIKDRLAARFRDYFFNFMFLDALMTGFLFIPGVFSRFLSSSRTLDYIGINYYTREFISFDGLWREKLFGAVCEKGHHKQQVSELNRMGWEIHADGLYQVLKKLKRFDLPILITENGVCADDDTARERFIKDHLDAVRKARREGIPVDGYLYWSLMDNFEWAHGFGPRFGIVEVDYATQQRKIRKSAQILTEQCRHIG